MTGVLHAAALALYVSTSGLFIVSLVRGAERLPLLATVLLGTGVGLHAGALAAFLAQWSQLPVAGLGPSLSTLAFLISVGSLIVATMARVGRLGLVLVPIVAVILAAALLAGIHPAYETTTFDGPWFVLHVLLAFIGYAGLTVAFAAGAMYLLQFRQLKSKRFGAIFRFFPPLETLDRLGRRALLVGFPALTVALGLAFAWTVRVEESVSPGNSHILWGVLSWVALLIALLARIGGGRHGHRGAVASVLGFVVVVLTFLLLRTYYPQSGAFL